MPPADATLSCGQLHAGTPHPEVLFREPSGGVGKAWVWPPFLNQVLPRRTIARRVLSRDGAHPVRARPVDLPVLDEYPGDPTNAGRVSDQASGKEVPVLQPAALFVPPPDLGQQLPRVHHTVGV